ncbi:deoxyguanosinetriphosphate triphosphohydrolase [Bacteroides sp. 214]|uniref:deoxyguanosinetriphosphate triphosphohydrolase n=1 Tax=Bacteroides sp. 214 TaxID=2302935 RepID=UPI0013D4B563|nr:deoxyguanosinetriphosphate triphosphohydrolase [Bacteroides sp. 214]NDW12464.1 deoxyguanosinetriphosphate triphosphohydrolase [Bacteroides sp. 214]
MDWRKLISPKRFGMEQYHSMYEENRSEFQRDYDRLIFSPAFRRLQNKTQVFPLPGSVFVHNRLTHSLEVSCVGRSLGNDCAKAILAKRPDLQDSYLTEISAIVAAACLAHDLGNPPFGHAGETAISTYFSQGNGKILEQEFTPEQWQDIIHFEGNANAFRLLSHQFNGRRKGGFAMTYSTLASIVKYPYASTAANGKSKFGFFGSEEESYRKIADELGIIKLQEQPLKYVRHPLVYLVEAADDICYQVMDVEDAFKLKILTSDETKELLFAFLSETQQAKANRIFEHVEDHNEQIAYLRSTVIGLLIKECTEVFVSNEDAILQGTFEGTLIKNISPQIAKAYRECSELAVKKIYRSRDVLDIELAGFRIISTLLDLMIEAVQEPDKAYSRLLINRVSDQYDIKAPELFDRVQAVLDYVSGMTDVYALDLYRKIKGNSLPAV